MSSKLFKEALSKVPKHTSVRVKSYLDMIEKGVTGRRLLEVIFSDNTYMIDEPEMKELEQVLDNVLKSVTQEQFDTIQDFRPYFALYKNREDLKVSCLHLLGEKAQRDYWFNGWYAYRMDFDGYKQRHILPSVVGQYLVCRKDGKVHFENWNGTGFAYNDNSIMWWQEVPKPPKQET